MLTLKNIKPLPLLKDGLDGSSQIWDKTLEFKTPENYLITAASGRGKSTFIHLLYGLRSDFEGQFLIDEKDSRKFSRKEWSHYRRDKIAIVFQDLRLFPKLSARDNILLNAQLQNKVTMPEIEAMAARLGITPLLDQASETLSYGQAQRVAIIRALCQDFEYLLLDEPFSHLDEKNISLASELIKEVCQKQKASLILVSLGPSYLFDYQHQWTL